ncbi:Zeatin O-xylosyltransferase [Capsicum annuum]|nr:Zeatin O-xylosyltransferase [Capsicum annuum]
MFGDQPRNSFLVTEVLKIGLTVREWEKREEIDVCSLHNVESYIFNCAKRFRIWLIQFEGEPWSNCTQNKKQWAIGPILPIKQDHVSDKRNKCLDWLDNQPSRSVLYVSFGSSTTFTDKEVTELAMVLERSKQKFLWVLRDADRGDIFTGEARRFELLEGYEERAKGVGLVVRDWAPQLEILAHSSTGRFMSHCGWNSCIESITMGVPIATWPMHSEQPLNGFFATEILKTGLLVREWEKREELVSASVIENPVRKLMVSEEGDEIRKRAEELGEAVRQSTEKGGASRLELDSFIAHITR